MSKTNFTVWDIPWLLLVAYTLFLLNMNTVVLVVSGYFLFKIAPSCVFKSNFWRVYFWLYSILCVLGLAGLLFFPVDESTSVDTILTLSSAVLTGFGIYGLAYQVQFSYKLVWRMWTMLLFSGLVLKLSNSYISINSWTELALFLFLALSYLGLCIYSFGNVQPANKEA